MKKIQKLTWLFLLVGLVIACKPAGEKAETTAAAEVEVATGKTYNVDAASSKVLWKGSKLTGSHNGTVDVSKGNLVMDNGVLKGGKFSLDMTSINSLDLEGDKKAYLESHLKGLGADNADDFFNVNKYPSAAFEISKATRLKNDENANYIISGNLTIKEVTKQISFKAKLLTEGNTIKVTTPDFTINRTDWGVNHNSASIVEGLKDKAINDNMGLSINLTASM